MPHVSDVRATSHDRHDPMLVAALAADDLAGTDRDQAIDLTRTCAECATLHDDLLALARATASVPPPIAARPRDFRLTPADAARLRPSGWRRLVAAASSSRVIFSRPLGAGLATLGLVGLLVGNVQLSMGSSAGAAPAPQAAASAAAAAAPAGAPGITNYDAASGATGGAAEGQVPVLAPAASAAAASTAPDLATLRSAAASTSTDQARGAPLGVLPDKSAASQPAAGSLAEGPLAGTRESQVNEPGRPLNLLFGAALIVGIALLVASGFRSRRPV
jgi:hypothetical protein